MNTTQAREISIEKVLQNLGYEPTKSNENDNWYLSPFRPEKTASFKLSKKLNRWFDHGEQKGGNVIDFVIQKFGFSVTEALTYLGQFDISFSFQKQIFKHQPEKKMIVIKKNIPVKHVALIGYLKSRGITQCQNIPNLAEIHYSINNRNYFALGFLNIKGGYELRSKYAKICLGFKAVSHINQGKDTLRIFEGFFDYLSFIQLENSPQTTDYLILNSVGLLEKNFSILDEYGYLELYLDNDPAGDKYVKIIKDNFLNAVDMRSVFLGFKDFNEWFSTVQPDTMRT
ncbi:toprim domain-containing protein [Flavobacterium frigidarium]|uniref:toprim domain-containing protein n=1 Tax=Flavobacterium frigidarium TaxID=99286 RepID=UPI0030DB1D8E|tara:strand:+ start:5093 stop:5947 length:855 start_codon:yes stop_codon:yes gene_type:complete